MLHPLPKNVYSIFIASRLYIGLHHRLTLWCPRDDRSGPGLAAESTPSRLEPWPRQLDRKLDSYSTATRQLLDRIARQSLTATRQTSTATRQKPPDSMCLGVKVSSSTARQSSTVLDRARQSSTELDRARQSRAYTDQLVRAPLLQGEG